MNPTRVVRMEVAVVVPDCLACDVASLVTAVQISAIEAARQYTCSLTGSPAVSVVRDRLDGDPVEPPRLVLPHCRKPGRN